MVPVLDFDIPVNMAYVLAGVLAIVMLLLPLRTILLLTLIFLTLPSLDTPFGPIARFLRWGCLAGMLGKGVFGSVRAGLRPTPHTTEHSIMLTFCALFLLSAFWSIGPEVTLAQGTMMVTLVIGVYVVLWNSWSTREDILGLCNTLFLVAALIFTLEAFYQVRGLGQVYGGGRYAGVFLNPNGLGTAVAFLGPFVFWKHYSSSGPVARIFCKGLGVMMGIGLILSGSRSGFLGAVICLGFIACYTYRVKLVLLAFLLAIPIALLIVIGRQLDTSALEDSNLVRMETLGDVGDRLPMWEDGLELIKERPILGYGYAMSKFANLGRADLEMAQAVYSMRGMNYHSAHLQVTLDLGVVGLLLFWYYLFSVTRRGIRIYRMGVRDPLHLGGIVFFAAFFALAGDSFVHGWAFSPGSSMSIVFFLVSAATVRIHLFVMEEVEEEEEEDQEDHEIPPAGTTAKTDLIRG